MAIMVNILYSLRKKREFMPSVSKKQEAFMRAIAHSRKFAEKVKVPQSVGKEFEAADKKKNSTMVVKRYGYK